MVTITKCSEARYRIMSVELLINKLAEGLKGKIDSIIESIKIL